MKKKFTHFVLIAIITLVGIEIGGGIYELMVFAPKWSASPPASFALLQGDLGLEPGIFWAPHHFAAQGMILLALILCWKDRKRRNLIWGIIGLYMILRIPTFLYFIPELGVFSTTPPEGTFSPDLAERARMWILYSWGRLGVIAGIYVLAWMALRAAKEKNVTNGAH
ncbi:hypothetical protein [Lihuaxuella thermophila]|uniref:DUF1772 domain-containing protein n=1 Tax=Lihuaxuella thermophila TaxID=1173111 RepID=A0A1H8GQ63_9BACL|nr:hypothetical protein [Lihuaxuella thermophila]SEN45959.1 hypothetical protein SAMN05444955_1124 [Lihuaxuella thermophila]